MRWRRCSRKLAGVGGTIRVDGFGCGKMPPKFLIGSIRFASGMFAAEVHGGGMTFVDIHSQAASVRIAAASTSCFATTR